MLEAGLALGIAQSILERYTPSARALAPPRAAADAEPAEPSILVIDGLIGDPLDEELDSWFGESLFTGPRRVREWLAKLDGGPGTVEVNSPGGAYFGAIDMTRLLAEHPGAISVRVSGIAASAASLLLTVAEDVAMFRGSMVMIHEPWTWAAGNAKALRAAAELLDKLTRDAVELYRRKMGASAEVLNLMEAETWFNLDEAMAVGLVDREIEPPSAAPDDPEPAMAAGWESAGARLMLLGRRRRR